MTLEEGVFIGIHFNRDAYSRLILEYSRTQDFTMMRAVAYSERRLASLYGMFPTAELVAADLSWGLGRQVRAVEVEVQRERRSDLIMLYYPAVIDFTAMFLATHAHEIDWIFTAEDLQNMGILLIQGRLIYANDSFYEGPESFFPYMRASLRKLLLRVSLYTNAVRTRELNYFFADEYYEYGRVDYHVPSDHDGIFDLGIEGYRYSRPKMPPDEAIQTLAKFELPDIHRILFLISDPVARLDVLYRLGYIFPEAEDYDTFVREYLGYTQRNTALNDLRLKHVMDAITRFQNGDGAVNIENHEFLDMVSPAGVERVRGDIWYARKLRNVDPNTIKALRAIELDLGIDLFANGRAPLQNEIIAFLETFEGECTWDDLQKRFASVSIRSLKIAIRNIRDKYRNVEVIMDAARVQLGKGDG